MFVLELIVRVGVYVAVLKLVHMYGGGVAVGHDVVVRDRWG